MPAVIAPVAVKAATSVIAPEAPKIPARPPKPTIPRWALPALAGLPIWVFAFLGVFSLQKEKLLGPAALGAQVYSNNCQSCHLANGAGSDAGGVGRPLYNGEAELTFLTEADQVAFVKRGSYEVGTPYGNPNRPGGQHRAKGGMAPWAGALTDEEITAAVRYERSVLQGKEFPAEGAGPAEGAAPAEGTDPAEGTASAE